MFVVLGERFSGILPRRRWRRSGATVVAAVGAANPEDPADVCDKNSPKLKGAAAQRVVKKLVDLGLIEDMRARGDLQVWRRDHDGGPMAVRIISDGSERTRMGSHESQKHSRRHSRESNRLTGA